jgi:hypothetical protein
MLFAGIEDNENFVVDERDAIGDDNDEDDEFWQEDIF